MFQNTVHISALVILCIAKKINEKWNKENKNQTKQWVNKNN